MNTSNLEEHGPRPGWIDTLRLVLGGTQDRNVGGVNALLQTMPHEYLFDAGSLRWKRGDLVRQGDNWLAVLGAPLGVGNLGLIRSWRQAQEAFTRWDGSFAAFYWDGTAQRLVIVTDLLGLQPIYLQRESKVLIIASETKAFRGEADLDAWGAFIAMGQTLADRTLMSGVKRLPAASVLVFDAEGRKAEERRYWGWPEQSVPYPVKSIAEALEHSIVAYQSQYQVKPRVLLSGGFDSRFLLFASRHCGMHPEVLSVSHADEHGDADGRIAQAIAKRVGVAALFKHPRVDFFSTREYLHYVYFSDASNQSMGLFITKLTPYVSGGAFLDGLVPGFMLGLDFAPDIGFAGYRKERVKGFESNAWRAARIVFRKEISEAMAGGFEQHLQEETGRYTDNDFGIFEFIVANRIRHRTSVSPIKVFSERALMFFPGMTRDFLEQTASVRRASGLGLEPYFRLFKEVYPEALDLPFVIGGIMKPARRGFWLYQRCKYAECRNRFLANYPSLRKVLHQKGEQHLSSFLQADDVLLEDDSYINSDAIHALTPEDPLYMMVRTLLFNWKAWNWLHQGQLFERLGRYAKA